MSKRGEVLVAITPKLQDFDILRRQLWYRIPVEKATQLLNKRWPPEWLAFYQTQIFGAESHSVSYYGRVIDSRQVPRHQLFPNEPPNEKSQRIYHQLFIDELRRRPDPIRSGRFRRIVFIPTTWAKFMSAVSVNDLFDDSPLEDLVWNEFKNRGIVAERQEEIEISNRIYKLDFAIYCQTGLVDVETDGDSWHANPISAATDNLRDNDLQSTGWTILRFGTSQLKERLAEYCLPKIEETINHAGGFTTTGMPRRIPVKHPDGSYQLGLLD